jgi:hypothetical protein
MGYRDLTGVDIRPPASEDSITYRQADLDYFRLDVPDGAFDLALAVEVIEHIEKSGAVSGGAGTAAAPGWYRFVHDPKPPFGPGQVAVRAH